MKRNTIKKASVATVGAALSLSGSADNSAFAVTVTYDFTVKVTEGSLSGQQFEGSFSYDGSTLTGIGSEEVGVKNGLSVSFEFLGVTYTQANDFNYPLYPRVLFEDGRLAGLDFEAFNSRVSYQIIRDFANKSSFFTYSLEEDETETMGSGIVTYSLRENSLVSLTELSTPLCQEGAVA